MPISLLRACRPRQWSKNVLVLAAPLAAGRFLEPDVARNTAVAFVVFCLASSATYLINDTADAEADRRHPVKRMRPIASGDLPRRVALGAAVCLALTALGGAAISGWHLVATIAAYLVISIGYSVWLKHEPVLDLAAVTAGFLLRAVSGGVASDLPVSHWFLMVAGFGALFMVAAKRYSEFQQLGDASGVRPSLKRYSGTYLRFVWSLAASATVIAYSLWAFEMSASAGGLPWHALSVAPFVMGILRYAVDADAAASDEPEGIVLGDRGLQLIGVVWLALLLLGVHGG